MKNALNKVASALSFAHLASLTQRSQAEDDDPKKKDDDEAKGSRAEDDDKPDDEKKAKSKSKVEDDDDPEKKDGDAEDDDPEKKDDESKAKRESDDDDADAEDDDDEEEMRGKSASAKARRRERARCAAIFGSKAAGRNPVLAANLAFNTSMTRKEALAVLEGTPAANPVGADRASRNPQLGAGGSVQMSGKQNIAARWDRAFQQAAPKR